MVDLTRYAKQSTLRLTTRGRKSGEPRTATVWFVVLDPQTLVVQHVRGDEANWYRNLRKHAGVQIDFGEGPVAARATPITDRAEINRVLAAIRKKYWLAYLLQALGTKNAVAATITLAV
jgi:deazaflavin-dependent oxidoreductase (nitroreductase family)